MCHLEPQQPRGAAGREAPVGVVHADRHPEGAARVREIEIDVTPGIPLEAYCLPV